MLFQSERPRLNRLQVFATVIQHPLPEWQQTLCHLYTCCQAHAWRWAARNVRTGTSDWSQHRKLLLLFSCVATSWTMVGFHSFSRLSTKVVSTSDGGKGLTLTNRCVRAAWHFWPLDAPSIFDCTSGSCWNFDNLNDAECTSITWLQLNVVLSWQMRQRRWHQPLANHLCFSAFCFSNRCHCIKWSFRPETFGLKSSVNHMP